MKLKLKIDQAAIDTGIPGNRFSCPIAIAAWNTPMPKGQKITSVSISRYKGSLVVDGKRLRFAMPIRASRFVGRYDRLGRHAVSPINIVLDIINA